MTLNFLGAVVLTGRDAEIHKYRVQILKTLADRAENDAINLRGVALKLQETGQDQPINQGEGKQ